MEVEKRILKVHPKDNVIVALQDFKAGDEIHYGSASIIFLENVPLKHKFSASDLNKGDIITMYGVTVGKALKPIPKGCRISTDNVIHASADYQVLEGTMEWEPPNISKWSDRTFNGYHRANGQVGTRNYWLVIPLVFCENRNIKVIEEAMLEKLGYASERSFAVNIEALIQGYAEGKSEEEILSADILQTSSEIQESQIFKNVDGIKFLTHDGGCGGIRQDSETLCNLLAAYIAHSNVAGATILSLGCQNAQISLLEAALKKADPLQAKPVYYIEQQKSSSEREFIAEAVKRTFVGLMHADKVQRKPAALMHLSLGLECGGSDGFSGISANPALGFTSDLLVALKGKTILSEFPELNGVEQELINRCTTRESAKKFEDLMRTYALRAVEAGSGFDKNPSPGNIKDGLITDAMKSAGAAKKGGTSPVVEVLDYTEQATKPGLSLLCTPGNDVESTTGLAGSGANLIVFTTGLGTPTGNPITPTVKLSSNTILADRMQDIIDIDAGTIISGQDTIESKGEELLDLLIEVASGNVKTKAERLGQNDFIPWKRGVSL